MWSEPVPKDSSPQIERRPASIKLPKNFQPRYWLRTPSPNLWAGELTSRDLEVLKTFLLGDKIDGGASRHTPSQTLDATFLEVRNRIGPVRNDSNRVTGSDERALSIDHIPIAVTIRGGTECNVVLLNSVDQGVSIGQVGVGVSSTEVGGRDAVLGGRFWETELVNENGTGVGTGNAVETIEKDIETLSVKEEAFDQVKVEDRFEELNVIVDRIDDLDFQRTISSFPDY